MSLPFWVTETCIYWSQQWQLRRPINDVVKSCERIKASSGLSHDYSRVNLFTWLGADNAGLLWQAINEMVNYSFEKERCICLSNFYAPHEYSG